MKDEKHQYLYCLIIYLLSDLLCSTGACILALVLECGISYIMHSIQRAEKVGFETNSTNMMLSLTQ